MLYEASGCAVDWARVEANIPHTYTIELKPTLDDVNDPLHGFDYPERLINKSAQEVYFGIKYYLYSFDYKSYAIDVISECNAIINDMQNFHHRPTIPE
jgi:hypothetical protein